MWNGDYLNLEAGAGTAIYIGGGSLWTVDTSLAMPMEFTVTWNGMDIIKYNPSEPQWWITGFNPKLPLVSAKQLTVQGSIDFSKHPELYKKLKDKYGTDFNTWNFSENNIAKYRW